MKKLWLASCFALSMFLGLGTNYAAATSVPKNVAADPLPIPQDSDVACNGAVDEAALKDALTEYAAYCNAALMKYENKDPTEMAKEVISWDTWNNPFSNYYTEEANEASYRNEAFFKIARIVEDLVDRWRKTQYKNSEVVLNADDQKIINLLAKYGIKPVIIEGIADLEIDVAFFRKRVMINYPAFTGFVIVLNSQPEILYSEDSCRYSVKEMGTWAVQWEQYLKRHQKDKFFCTEGRKHYLEFVDFILFSELRYTPAFPDYNNYAMESEWMEQLESVAAENPGTETAKLISEFLKKVKANKNKLSPAAKKEISQKMNALFLPKK